MDEQKPYINEAEQQRVDEVIKEIDKKISKIGQNTGALKQDIVDLRKTFWDDVTVNLDEPDDVIETHTSLRQQSELLSERERSHGLFYKQLDNLKRLKYSPYFGRIDFREEGEENVEKVYIGLFSLMDENEENFLIYDWRAPISSMYYDYAPGPAQYDILDDTVSGEIKLKRQYIIRDGKLKGMFDTGMVIGDEILQEVLSNQANPKMKSIVATIQKEQNQIIRNEQKKFLIVQGAAGSGKTSAALQRVAFLLYRHREKLTANNILLFSPNEIFNSYVQAVLPELGEENMEQSTFYQYLNHRLGRQLHVEDPLSQVEYMLGAEQDQFYVRRKTSIQIKAGLYFKKIMDRFVEDLGKTGMIFRNIVFRGDTFITKEEIAHYFYQLEPSVSIPNRLMKVKEWLLSELRKKEKHERTKEWVEEERELLSREDYVKVYKKLQKEKRFTEDTFNDFEREEALLSRWIVRGRMKPLRRKISQLAFLDTLKLYQAFFDWTLEQEELDLPPNWSEICQDTISQLKKRKLYYEDATPFLYLKDKIEGKSTYMGIRHLLIDEAQDYSPFQFAYLKEIFPNSHMTILGDVNQSIFTHAINDQNGLEKSNELFPKGQLEIIQLSKSYRSTKQIIEFSEEILTGNHPIEPFNRNGNVPRLEVVTNKQQLHDSIIDRINKLKRQKHETIAIICKTEAETKEAYERFKGELDLHLVQKETTSYEKGLLIIPSYLAKGIEFDTVVIYNCNHEVYREEEERTVLYTACTRAMHALYLFSVGQESPLLSQVDKSKYARNME